MKASHASRIATVLLIAVVVAIGVWISRSGSDARPASRPSPTPTAVETSPLASPSSSPTTTVQRTAFETRVLEFEQAYNLLDPAARLSAIRPYVTDRYMDELVAASEESDYLSKLRQQSVNTVDLSTANVYPDEDADPGAMEVFTTLPVTTTDEDGSQTFTVHHTTYWVLDASGAWLVHGDDP